MCRMGWIPARPLAAAMYQSGLPCETFAVMQVHAPCGKGDNKPQNFVTCEVVLKRNYFSFFGVAEGQPHRVSRWQPLTSEDETQNS